MKETKIELTYNLGNNKSIQRETWMLNLEKFNGKKSTFTEAPSVGKLKLEQKEELEETKSIKDPNHQKFESRQQCFYFIRKIRF